MAADYLLLADGSRLLLADGSNLILATTTPDVEPDDPGAPSITHASPSQAVVANSSTFSIVYTSRTAL